MRLRRAAERGLRDREMRGSAATRRCQGPIGASRCRSASDADVCAVLENGIREISGEVRNSLDFHRSQDGGGEVSHVVLSGAAQSTSPASPRRFRRRSASRSRSQPSASPRAPCRQASRPTGWRSPPGSPRPEAPHQ